MPTTNAQPRSHPILQRLYRRSYRYWLISINLFTPVVVILNLRSLAISLGRTSPSDLLLIVNFIRLAISCFIRKVKPDEAVGGTPASGRPSNRFWGMLKGLSQCVPAIAERGQVRNLPTPTGGSAK